MIYKPIFSINYSFFFFLIQRLKERLKIVVENSETTSASSTDKRIDRKQKNLYNGKPIE